MRGEVKEKKKMERRKDGKEKKVKERGEGERTIQEAELDRCVRRLSLDEKY